MATYRLRHFSNPQILQAIEPSRLLDFLNPYRSFFKSREYELPDTDEGALDYRRLVEVFMSPSEHTPQSLIDALFLVDEMSTPTGMDALLEAASKDGLQLTNGEKDTPADVAVQVWLLNPAVLERQHAQRFVARRKSFHTYGTHHDVPTHFAPPSVQQLEQSAQQMDDWFILQRRGRGTQVFYYGDQLDAWFLIRHGEPFKREESLTEGQASSTCYRPLVYDVVVYSPESREMRINSKLVGARNLYREVFAAFLLGNGASFSESDAAKYTLEPLRDQGPDSLAGGVDGIDSVTLKEIHLRLGGAYGETEVLKADDLWAAWSIRGFQIPDRATLIKAAFSIQFADAQRPRTITIVPPTTADYSRDSDGKAVEGWLRQRGFKLERTAPHADGILANT